MTARPQVELPELPEPLRDIYVFLGEGAVQRSTRAFSAGRYFSADDMHAYARAALAALPHMQPAGEAVACQFQDREGKWCNFNNDEHRDNTIVDGSWPIRWLYTTPQPGDGVDAARLDWLRDNEFDLVTWREDIDEDEYHILWFVIDPRKTTRSHLHSISGHPLGSPREAIDAAIARSAAPSAEGV